jgi:hypothetical protein
MCLELLVVQLYKLTGPAHTVHGIRTVGAHEVLYKHHTCCAKYRDSWIMDMRV